MIRVRVRMVTTLAGPDGVVLAGQVADFPADQARLLLAGGYALAVEEPGATQRLETAALAPPEAAVQPRAPKHVKTKG